MGWNPTLLWELKEHIMRHDMDDMLTFSRTSIVITWDVQYSLDLQLTDIRLEIKIMGNNMGGKSGVMHGFVYC